jgi:hypothetical protein
MCGNIKVMTPPESCEKAIKSENIAYASHVVTCKMVKEHSAHLLYLPAYSPDFNPIELAFSTIKAWLHRNRDHVNREMESEDGTVYNTLWEAVYSVTVGDTKGWYAHCGYT